ncbi:hypothetical protein ASF46_13315 [Rathayibacter sp. Leaf296]|nr:hypothetical protein ASF46_13315 [Rathayibacter sp. Leaf296]
MHGGDLGAVASSLAVTRAAVVLDRRAVDDVAVLLPALVRDLEGLGDGAARDASESLGRARRCLLEASDLLDRYVRGASELGDRLIS